jgi:trimeric autotransporter adhesin
MRGSGVLVFCGLIGGLISGCGSGFKGTVNTGGGTPQPPAGAPTVTSLSPSSTVAGGAEFTLTVTGTNFASGDTVDWDFTPLTSTYVSSTEMKAQVPASLIAKPGTSAIDVVTTTPATLNFGSTFTITVPPLPGNASYTMTAVNVAAKDMVWDPISQQFYLSVPGNNSITTLDPASGQLGTPVILASAPDRLAISSDGAYLYAGMDASGTVQRFTLPGVAPDISISLGSYLNNGPMYALDVEVAPGCARTVAISRGAPGVSPSEEGGVAIYDDATPRPNSVPGFGSGPGPIDRLLWKADGSAIYGADTEGTSADLYVLPVDANGVEAGQDFIIGGTLGFVPRDYNSTTGYVYAATGQAVDPADGSVVGTFPFDAVLGGADGYYGVVTDGKINLAYFLVQAQWDTNYGEDVLEVFDLTHFTFLGGIAVPGAGALQVKMLRWGNDGLAVLTQGSVILINGGFVTSPAPQHLGAGGVRN